MTWLLIQMDGKVFKEDLRAVFDVSTWRSAWLGRGRIGDGFVGSLKMD